MATIEKLLAMGSPRSPDLERVGLGLVDFGGGSAANDRLTWQDVHAALGMLTAVQRAVLQLKARPEQVSARELAALCDALMDFHASWMLHRKLSHALAGRQHTPAERAVFHAQTRHAADLVRTALQEYQTPNTCRHCRGSGKVRDVLKGEGNHVRVVIGTCGACEGRAWVKWSDNRRVRAAGVTRGDWIPRYAAPYEGLIRELSRLYREAATEFKRRLFGNDPAANSEPSQRLSGGAN